MKQSRVWSQKSSGWVIESTWLSQTIISRYESAFRNTRDLEALSRNIHGCDPPKTQNIIYWPAKKKTSERFPWPMDRHQPGNMFVLCRIFLAAKPRRRSEGALPHHRKTPRGRAQRLWWAPSDVGNVESARWNKKHRKIHFTLTRIVWISCWAAWILL